MIREAADRARVLVAVAVVGAGALAACDPRDDSGADAGTPDAGVPQVPLDPIAMEFEAVTLPTAPLRVSLASAGDALFSSTVRGLERSVDRGASWQLVSTLPLVAFAGDGGGRLLAITPAELLTSQDADGTFSAAPLPAELGVPGRLVVSGDDAAWVLSQAAPFSLARSADQGATFAMVTMPPASFVTPCTALGDAIAFIVDGASVVRVTTDGPTVLGAAPAATACVATATGEVIVSAFDGAPVELVFTDALTAPVRRDVDQAFRYAGAGARIVRWGSNGAIAQSLDHGVTFTPRDATPLPPPFNLDGLVLVPGALVALTQQGVAELDDDAPGWLLHAPTGLPPNPAPRDLSFAASSGGAAMLLDDNIQRAVYVTRDGVTWQRGLTFAVADAQAIAIDPSGTRVIVAGQLGGYTILGDDGRTVLHSDQIENAAGLVETDTVRSILWGPDPAGSVIIAGVADDTDTRGRLWQLDGEADHNTWLTLTPTETAQAPALREGGYHALAVSAAGAFEGNAPEDRALVVSFRSFVTTGSWTTQLLTQFRLFDNDSSWDEAAPPVRDSAAVSSSWQAQASRGVAMLWPNDRLFFGRDMRFLRAVLLPAGLTDLRVARFAPDGRLWLSTGTGIVRSITPPSVEE